MSADATLVPLAPPFIDPPGYARHRPRRRCSTGLWSGTIPSSSPRASGTKKPTVERHQQATIRATVQPAPYGETARKAYRPK